MREEKYTCDRCGHVAEKAALTINDYNIGDIDLCSVCYGDLRQWVKDTTT